MTEKNLYCLPIISHYIMQLSWKIALVVFFDKCLSIAEIHISNKLNECILKICTTACDFKFAVYSNTILILYRTEIVSNYQHMHYI